jgi:hypothetical protein
MTSGNVCRHELYQSWVMCVGRCKFVSACVHKYVSNDPFKHPKSSKCIFLPISTTHLHLWTVHVRTNAVASAGSAVLKSRNPVKQTNKESRKAGSGSDTRREETRPVDLASCLNGRGGQCEPDNSKTGPPVIIWLRSPEQSARSTRTDNSHC